MQFFTATLLLVALAQSNAQFGSFGDFVGKGLSDLGDAANDATKQLTQGLGNGLGDLGGVIDQGVNSLTDVISQPGLDIALSTLANGLSGLNGAQGLVDDLEKSLDSDNLIDVLTSILSIVVKTVIGLFTMTIERSSLPQILLSLGSVLQFSSNGLIKGLGTALLTVGGLLVPVLGGGVLGSLGGALGGGGLVNGIVGSFGR